MYAAISHWKFGSAAQATEALRRLRADLGPLIRQQPGLRQWYAVATGTDEGATVSIWENRAAYEAAQPAMALWAQERLTDLDARVQHRRRGDIAAVETYKPPDDQPGTPANDGD